jgi:hypothetical protein
MIHIASISSVLLTPNIVKAVQGSVKTTPIEETKVAIKQIAAVLSGIELMTTLAQKDQFVQVAEVFGRQEYTNFDEIATKIVRSDALSQEDKVALGTIKRYGVVADAIIMLGGAKGELRSGGIVLPGDSSNEDEENEDDEPKAVNKKELLKYLKLSKDSLSDIYKIVEPVLQKSG